MSPNSQLYLSLGLFFVFTVMLAAVFSLLYRQNQRIESKFGKVTPFWHNLRSVCFAILRHPHAWARPLDRLMDLAENEPEVPLSPEDYEEYLLELDKRVHSDEPDLRPHEKAVAAIVLLALPIIRGEAEARVKLTGIKLIGSQAPSEQSSADAKARLDA